MSQINTPDIAQDQSASSISAAAHAYQVAMQDQQPATPPSAPVPQAVEPMKDDVLMAGMSTPTERAASPAIPASANNAPSPLNRNNTPVRTNGENTPRAASLHPDTAASTIPKEARPNGAPTRQYLNSKVTQVLLDGMKKIAKEQPDDPLRVLGEYLLQRSRDLEGT